MSFLQRTGRRFAASAVMVACFAASSAFAAMLATNDFETSFADFTTDEELATLAIYDPPRSGSAAYPFESFGSKYLAIDSDTTTIWRSFDEQTATTYFDSYVQFTPMYGDFEYDASAKFLIYLDSETNLCVVSGTAAGDRTAVTNTLAVSVEANSWHRLTVCAMPSDGVFAFQVYIDGTLRSTSGSVNTFYSLTADSTLSEVGFSGTGALDNFAVRTTAPTFGNVVATIDGEDFATLEEALAEADADTVVTLAADHAGKVYLADAATYKIDNSGGHAFGGVVGANGYKVTAGNPVAGVTTYTAMDAFASQPAPVVLWDGASENCDFSTLTRTVGANTYTLNLNSQNTVGGGGSYVQIGPNDAQKAVTLTVQNSDPAVTNGFGTANAVTVIMKYRDMPVASGSNRAIISLSDGKTYNGSGAVVGIGASNKKGGFITRGKAGWYWNDYSSKEYGKGLDNAFATGDHALAMTYSYANGVGTSYYIDGVLMQTATDLRESILVSPCAILLGGLDIDSSSQFFAMTGMKIEAVAVFTSALTAEQVAAYAFPSQRIAEDVVVSEINGIFGSDSEIWLDVAEGVTITGDTTFNASTVHFTSAGEVVLYPPAGNTSTFDFSGVLKPVVAYNGAIPTKSGDKFTATTVPTWVTDSAQWTGTVWLKNIPNSDNQGQAFNPNNFGNDAATVRLTNLTGYFARYLTVNPAIELFDAENAPAVDFTNGYGRGEITTLAKLCGTGTMKAATKTGGSELIRVKDWAEFTGTLNLTSGKVVVFDDKETMDGDVYEYANGICYGDGDSWGMVYVASNVTVTVPSGKTWTADKGVHVAGTLAYESLARLSAGTSVVLRDSGLIDVPGTGSVANFAMDFSKVSGTGAIKYTGSSWGGISTNHLASTIGVVLENTAGVIVPNALTPTPNAENVITNGYLSGSGGLRCDYNWNGSGDNKYRTLRVQQDRNSTWSGTHIDEQNRLTLSVAPGASTTGTLTLSGTQTQSAALVVETNASVCITGTWKGTVTVYGTLSGTNTITGAVTLSDGATLKVDDTSHRLSATSLTASGTVSVVLPAGTGTGTFITTSAMPNVSGAKFNVYVGGNLDKSLYVIATSDGLVVKRGVMFLFH